MAAAIVIAATVAAPAGAGTTGLLGSAPAFADAVGDCPEGTYVSSVGVEGELPLVANQLRCSDASGAEQLVLTLVLFGGTGSDFTYSRCAAADLSTGIYGRSGDVVDAVGLQCQGDDGELAGGSGGGPRDLPCPGDELLTGMHVTFDSYGPDAVGIYTMQGRCSPNPFYATTLTAQSVQAATTADRAPRVAATLRRTDDGSPLAGRTVRFLSGTTELCRASTGTDGRASCVPVSTGTGTLVTSRRFGAVFAGDALARPSASDGALLDDAAAPRRGAVRRAPFTTSR